ncbi:hypothetical protein CYMTET_43251 [Cymbomonas tetramitiformis]|uniref:RWP-RK domain-containing protein n=1 Tax=Cymbomonas tetramitiformis TaxID=36881 RepID=A0AAE0C2J7_9CHLO|nr:hypothetical protein CYMTET_43251 [Cymbomonas tetramitiformis]
MSADFPHVAQKDISIIGNVAKTTDAPVVLLTTTAGAAQEASATCVPSTSAPAPSQLTTTNQFEQFRLATLEFAHNAYFANSAASSVLQQRISGQEGQPVPNEGKKGRISPAADITKEDLSACFHLPSEAACKKLGIGLTVLKRQCRKYGIRRWPFRKMKSLDRLISNVQAGISPGDQNRTLVKSVEELEEQKRKMENCVNLDLDDQTKRLQQAFSKANHKARRLEQTHRPDQDPNEIDPSALFPLPGPLRTHLPQHTYPLEPCYPRGPHPAFSVPNSAIPEGAHWNLMPLASGHAPNPQLLQMAPPSGSIIHPSWGPPDQTKPPLMPQPRYDMHVSEGLTALSTLTSMPLRIPKPVEARSTAQEPSTNVLVSAASAAVPLSVAASAAPLALEPVSLPSLPAEVQHQAALFERAAALSELQKVQDPPPPLSPVCEEPVEQTHAPVAAPVSSKPAAPRQHRKSQRPNTSPPAAPTEVAYRPSQSAGSKQSSRGSAAAEVPPSKRARRPNPRFFPDGVKPEGAKALVSGSRNAAKGTRSGGLRGASSAAEVDTMDALVSLAEIAEACGEGSEEEMGLYTEGGMGAGSAEGSPAGCDIGKAGMTCSLCEEVAFSEQHASFDSQPGEASKSKGTSSSKRSKRKVEQRWMFIPCQHARTCRACAFKLWMRDPKYRQCPFCAKDIEFRPIPLKPDLPDQRLFAN